MNGHKWWQRSSEIRLMVTIHDKGSDNVRLRSGSCHVMTKKTSIWVPMCKEKRMKNSGESNFRYRTQEASSSRWYVILCGSVAFLCLGSPLWVYMVPPPWQVDWPEWLAQAPGGNDCNWLQHPFPAILWAAGFQLVHHLWLNGPQRRFQVAVDVGLIVKGSVQYAEILAK